MAIRIFGAHVGSPIGAKKLHNCLMPILDGHNERGWGAEVWVGAKLEQQLNHFQIASACK
jgi:hypothetical protein